LLKILAQNAGQPMETIKTALDKALDEHQGKEDQRDDITIIGLRAS